MTILQLSTSSGPGGAERMISSLAEALNRDGTRVMVGLFRPGWLKTQCEQRKVETRVLPLAGPFHASWFRECLRLVRSERVSLIHAHEFSAIVYGWVVARLAGIPLIATIHGKSYFADKGRRRAAYRIVSRSGQFVAVSQDLKRFVSARVGIPVQRIEVIYNGVARAPLVSEEDRQACRAELDLRPESPILGVVGSLYPVKGHQYVLEAMPAVLRACPEAVLLVAGRGELDVALKEQAKRLGIERHVRFLGMRHDIPRLLAVMDLFVLPSLSEGLSLALLEAMAAGKPVVASRVGGNPELIVEGRTGILVEAGDVRGLADGIVRLLADRPMLQRFGREGAVRVNAQFSIDRMVEQYRALYARQIAS